MDNAPTQKNPNKMTECVTPVNRRRVHTSYPFHFSSSPVGSPSRPIQLPQFNTNCLGLNTRAVFFTEHLVVSYPRKPQSSFLK